MKKYMLVSENQLSKMKFFWCQGIFFINLNFKNRCKNEFKDDNKNHAADPEKGFFRKSIKKPYGRATAMPPS